MIQAVIFDLDDTLYRESDFLASGYRAVASYVASKTTFTARDVFDAMMATLADSGRQAVLPAVMSRFLRNATVLSELVEVYRTHFPRIEMPPGYRELLDELRSCYRLGIITDGIPEVQRRKVSALGLQDAVEHIVVTWDFGREREKPDPLPFLQMLETLGVEPRGAVYVGDSNAKDCIGAHRAGMRFIKTAVWDHIGVAASPEAEEADFVVASLLELPRLLKMVD